MKFGFVFPYGDARQAADMAREAERAGWDGFFVWEPVWGFDAWIQLTAAAMQTSRIRLGTMITPLSRMRPWKLASETVTLDHLSNGRVILSVGLGATDTGFEAFGEQTDRKTRAGLLDEGLDILTGLWRGQPFQYDGKHYHIRESNFLPPPPPVQQPRIPVWVVGAWGYPKSMKRALHYDGLLPAMRDEAGRWRSLKPGDIPQIKVFIERERQDPGNYDIIVEGTTPGDRSDEAAEKVHPWAKAGATWWIEALWDATQDPDGFEKAMLRVRQGPPS
jgi:hypothetical protein